MGSKFPSASFFFANVTLSLKASLISSLGWPSRQSVFSLTGEHSFSFYCYKFVSESLKGSHLVSRLRTAFGSDNGYAAWPMCNAHSGFSLVPVLSAGPPARVNSISQSRARASRSVLGGFSLPSMEVALSFCFMPLPCGVRRYVRFHHCGSSRLRRGCQHGRLL